MNAPDIRHIPLDLLKPTEHNPRRIRPDDPKLRELADSILAHSQLQPGVARPHPEHRGHFELLAGGRRWWACQIAGLDSMLVSVVDLDDRAAVEVTVLENLQRAELSPLEEASGIRMLVKSGATAEQIAAKIGKSWAWVVRRDRLNDLSPAWQKELADPESRYSHFTAAHLELVARYDSELQDRLLEELKKSLWSLPRSVEQLEKALDEYQAKLGKALWDLDDATLFPGAGACTSCPKRSSCAPGLFDTEPVIDLKRDQCLDVKCFARKMRAHLERKAAELREEHPNLVLLKRGYDERGLKGSIDEWSVEKAKKSDKGARPALVTAGPGKGSVTWVKLKRDAQAEVAEQDPAAAEKLTKKKAKQDAERAVLNAFAEKLVDLPRPASYDEKTALAVLLAQDDGYYFDIEQVAAAVERAPVACLLDDAWKRLLDALGSSCRDAWRIPSPAKLKRIAELVGLDIAAIRKSVRKN